MQAKSSPKVRRAVLGLVLYEHPKELTARELREEIGDDARGAIVDLLEAGLVKREGDYVRPTRPALNFYRLDLS
jgi:chromosome segregation and condensation protein ScpB